jgi:hypothetical protein
MVGALHSSGLDGPTNDSMTTVAATTVVVVVLAAGAEVVVVVSATEVLLVLVETVVVGSESFLSLPHAEASNTSTTKTTRKRQVPGERIVGG